MSDEQGELRAAYRLSKALVDAARRDWADAFDRAEVAEAKVARVEALHVKVFTSVSDEVYGNNPTCACGHHWPCETRAALDGGS